MNKLQITKKKVCCGGSKSTDCGQVIVKTIEGLCAIPCSTRKDGMIAIVIEEGYSWYQLRKGESSNDLCDNDNWIGVEFSGSGQNLSKDFVSLNKTEEIRGTKTFVDDDLGARAVIGKYVNKRTKEQEEEYGKVVEYSFSQVSPFNGKRSGVFIQNTPIDTPHTFYNGDTFPDRTDVRIGVENDPTFHFISTSQGGWFNMKNAGNRLGGFQINNITSTKSWNVADTPMTGTTPYCMSHFAPGQVNSLKINLYADWKMTEYALGVQGKSYFQNVDVVENLKVNKIIHQNSAEIRGKEKVFNTSGGVTDLKDFLRTEVVFGDSGIQKNINLSPSQVLNLDSISVNGTGIKEINIYGDFNTSKVMIGNNPQGLEGIIINIIGAGVINSANKIMVPNEKTIKISIYNRSVDGNQWRYVKDDTVLTFAN